MSTTTKNAADPIATFDAAVAEYMADGATRATAINRVATDRPKLHRAYLDAVNDRDPVAAAREDTVATFNAAVDAKVAGGMARPAAVNAVRLEQPTLHGRYMNVVSGADPRKASPPPPADGAHKVAGAAGDGPDAVKAFNAAVDAKVAAGHGPGRPMSRAAAIANVVAEQPKLHRAYLEAVNAGRGR